MKHTRTMALHVIDRCLSAAAFCVENGNDAIAVELMRAEFREVAREVAFWELGGIKKAGLFLQPMEKKLVKCYGSIVGRRIYRDFVDSFWIQSWTDVPLEESRLNRPVANDNEWLWRHMARQFLRRLFTVDDFSNDDHRD